MTGSRRAPGPGLLDLVGLASAFHRDPRKTLLDIARRYGPVVHLRLGPYPTYLLTDPEGISRVLVNKEGRYVRPRLEVEAFRSLLGQKSFLLAEGPAWEQPRRVMQPLLQHRGLERVAGRVEAVVEAAMESWAARREPIDLADELVRLTLGVMSSALLGADLGERFDTLREPFDIALHHPHRRMASVLRLPEWAPTPENRRYRAALRVLDETVYELIARRRAATSSDGLLLDALIAGEGDVFARDQVVTLFYAGYSTSGTTLTWALYLLSQHPVVLEELRREVDTVVGARSPAYADLAALRYLRMVIQEALRLYPPVWLTGREAAVDDVVAGFAIPAGAAVLVSPYAAHHAPALWPDPERFDPDRFAPERSGDAPRSGYYPFGVGPRACVGSAFAMMEMALILASIVQRFELHLAPGQDVRPGPWLSMHPSGGMRMILAERRYWQTTGLQL